VEKGHGRLEIRRIWTSTALNEYVDFPYVGQVFCVQREVLTCKTNKKRTETICGISSLSAEKASPERLLQLNRGHWSIENRLHWIRDVTFDEDRSQIRAGTGPQVMACLRNFAIGLLRLKKFSNIAKALRDMAARPYLVLRLLGW
jgi:predicted transposase YbfD/YdcC